MNSLLIGCSIIYIIIAIGCFIKKNYSMAIFMLMCGLVLSYNIDRNIEIINHEPLLASIQDSVLIVVDSNKVVYIDSLYNNGKVCLSQEVHTNLYGIKSSSKDDWRLNTYCQ